MELLILSNSTFFHNVFLKLFSSKWLYMEERVKPLQNIPFFWVPDEKGFCKQEGKRKIMLPPFPAFPSILFYPFPNKPWFSRVCRESLLKKMWEKKKLLVTSNFFFSHSVFYPFWELSAIFIKHEVVVCKLFQFGRV